MTINDDQWTSMIINHHQWSSMIINQGMDFHNFFDISVFEEEDWSKLPFLYQSWEAPNFGPRRPFEVFKKKENDQNWISEISGLVSDTSKTCMTSGPERPFRYLDCPNYISTPSIIPVTRVTKDYNAQSFRISILVNINTTCWLKLNSQWRHFIIHQIYLQMCTTDIGSQAGLILSSETPMLALPPSIHTECHRWSSTTEGRLPALIAWWPNSQWNQRHQ